ncbi:mRNA-degrading endonuclease toxin of MazEF toxin-antitoxin module [Streptacidiphilus sp. MAP12-16]|uniref:transposase family protein n=1 Tax=Streptacidiphilus sp. MAP12-16 TaxID=3156300 RepID=UPI0035135C8E
MYRKSDTVCLIKSPVLDGVAGLPLVERLKVLPDPRRRRGVRHPFVAVLLVAASSVVAGAKSFAAIGQWAANALGWLGARVTGALFSRTTWGAAGTTIVTIATFRSIMVSALSPVPGGDGRAVQSGKPSITVGSLWWMPTVVISGNDPKERRPIVVVQGVRYGSAQVITRTSDVKMKGILHPAEPEIELNKPGVFSMRHLHSIEERYFSGSTVQYLGMLGNPYLQQVLEMWES